MQHTLKTFPGSQVLLTVTLDGDELRHYLDETEKQLTNDLRLAGFRPGKAPRELMRQRIGEERIKQQALELAIQDSFTAVLKKAKLDIVEQEKLQIKINQPGELTYEVSLLITPRVQVEHYTGLKIERRPITVTASDIDHTLTELQQLRTVRLPVVERSAQLGDRAEVDFVIKLSGVTIANGESQNHPLVLGKDSFVPGFAEQIVGLKVNDKKDFTLDIPEDFYQKNIAGKTVTISLVLKKLESLSIPVLDDAFAQSLGQFKDLAGLKNNIQAGLELEKSNQEKERVRLAILAGIAKKNSFDCPAVLIERRLDRMLTEFDHNLHERGLELGLYLAQIKKTQAELRREWQGRAEQQAKYGLIIHAVSRQEKLQADPAEIEQELASLADQYAKRGQIAELQATDPALIKQRIEEVLINEKVLSWLEQHNIAVVT